MNALPERGRERAQVIVLFAIALLAMLAAMGVAIDGGELYVQRRTAQNAADAAALAGSRAMQQATVLPTSTVPSRRRHDGSVRHVPRATGRSAPTLGDGRRDFASVGLRNQRGRHRALGR